MMVCHQTHIRQAFLEQKSHFTVPGLIVNPASIKHLLNGTVLIGDKYFCSILASVPDDAALNYLTVEGSQLESISKLAPFIEMKQTIVLADEIYDAILHQSSVCKDLGNLNIVKIRKELTFRIVDTDYVAFLEIDCEINIRRCLENKRLCFETLQPAQTVQIYLLKLIHLPVQGLNAFSDLTDTQPLLCLSLMQNLNLSYFELNLKYFRSERSSPNQQGTQSNNQSLQNHRQWYISCLYTFTL